MVSFVIIKIKRHLLKSFYFDVPEFNFLKYCNAKVLFCIERP